MSHNVFYSCIIVARDYLNEGEGVQNHLKEISEAYSDIKDEKLRFETEKKAYKRIYIDNVKACASF